MLRRLLWCFLDAVLKFGMKICEQFFCPNISCTSVFFAKGKMPVFLLDIKNVFDWLIVKIIVSKSLFWRNQYKYAVELIRKFWLVKPETIKLLHELVYTVLQNFNACYLLSPSDSEDKEYKRYIGQKGNNANRSFKKLTWVGFVLTVINWNNQIFVVFMPNYWTASTPN